MANQNAGQTDPLWTKANLWVKMYSWVTLIAVILGIGSAHIPFLIGHDRSSCDGCSNELWCIIAFHLYEVPITLFNAFVGWYGIKKYAPDTVQQFMSLLSFAVTANLIFFTFEFALLYTNFHTQGSDMNNASMILTVVGSVLIIGAFFGMYLKHLLLNALYQPTTQGK